MTADDVAMFFRSCEGDASGSLAAQDAGGPEWLTALASAHSKELAFDLAGAGAALATTEGRVPEGPFRWVAELLALRVLVRQATADSLADAVPRIEALLRLLGPDDLPTRVRTLHLLSVAQVRLGRLEAAEEALSEAIEGVDDGPALIWMADTLAQVLIGQGAWCEAIRTLTALVARRRMTGDRIGVAISAGHLIRLGVQLGRPAEAATLGRQVLDELGRDAPLLTRLRIHTLMTGALVDLGTKDERLAPAVKELQELTDDPAIQKHFLLGYALMTLARASAVIGDAKQSRRLLDRTRAEFTLAGHVALLGYQEARIDPSIMDRADWMADLEKLWASMDNVSEAEVQTRLLHARRAFDQGAESDVRPRLSEAYARAMQSNNPLWMRWVDEMAAEIDASQLSERLALRYSGRSRVELQRTKREDVTVIFADLVNFTPRALVLSPEDVMDTVRGLFELGVPLMTKHRVTPLTYMGDGLLAIAQGPDHEQRGLEFAQQLVRRAGRVTRVRETLATGWPLELRAGAASGTVVLGSLGTLFKTEFAAIGATTNMAARLQAAAQPGEVVCSARTAWAAGLDVPTEMLTLKGWEGSNPVEACRIPVHKPVGATNRD